MEPHIGSSLLPETSTPQIPIGIVTVATRFDLWDARSEFRTNPNNFLFISVHHYASIALLVVPLEYER